MRLYKYFIFFFSLVVCTSLKNNCVAQLTYVRIEGNFLTEINRQVTYSPIFEDLNGHVLSVEQIGLTSIEYSCYSVSGPAPIASQSGLNYNVIWRSLDTSYLNCTIATWDNYMEIERYLLVYPKSPLFGGCVWLNTQTIFYENLPREISASQAQGGAGKYVYQWQWSADNVTFHDIPNTNSQYLYFTSDMSWAHHQLPGTTIYIQRKTISGEEEQYSNISTVHYIATQPIYARLEITPRDSSYWEDDDEKSYTKWVESWVRFYSDEACTIPYHLPANINCQIRWCRYYESGGSIITNECDVPDYYNLTAIAGQSEFTNGDFEDFEGYYFTYNGSQWELTDKWWSDYELIVAESCIIKPPIYPTHLPGFGISNNNSNQ